MEDNDNHNVLRIFYERLMDSQENIDPEFVDVVNENFDNLKDNETEN